MPRKYNPYLKGMTDDWRRKLEKETPNCTLNYSDEDLYKNIMYWYAVQPEDPKEDEQDFWYRVVRQDINNSVKRPYD